MSQNELNPPKSVGIIGYGNFGAFLHELIRRLAPSVEIKIFSPEKSVDGTRFFSRAEVAQCDAVVFAAPIREYENALKETVSLMKKRGIIVDVATVKMHTVGLLKKYCAGRPYIATHPMFGPESYAKRNKDVTDFRIVIAEHTLSDDVYSLLTNFLRQLHFNVIEMTADAHDKHLAETLFLTHFIGQVVTQAGFDRTEIDTVSFGFLMDAVESVRADTKLFTDVYRFNPHCADVLLLMESVERDVRSGL